MVRTTLTKQAAGGSYPGTPPTLTFAAANFTDGNAVALTGNELIIAHNTTGAGINVTAISVADPYGRTGNLIKSVPANGFAIFGPYKKDGWAQPSGLLHLDIAATGIEFAVVQLA